jgi:hypothetical protein
MFCKILYISNIGHLYFHPVDIFIPIPVGLSLLAPKYLKVSLFFNFCFGHSFELAAFLFPHFQPAGNQL